MLPAELIRAQTCRLESQGVSENDDDDDEEAPVLSEGTFAALKEFYREQDEREVCAKESAVLAATFDPASAIPSAPLPEDWQLSQFWYESSTALSLAGECVRAAADDVREGGGAIACVSCPTLYTTIRKHFPAHTNVKLFEFDRRFASVAGSDFVFYDYKAPLSLPRDFRESFSVVFADPPFLSEECLTKTSVTVKFLASSAIILCSGGVMADLAERLLGLKLCHFKPKHQNNLANEFRCFANYELDQYVVSEKSNE